MEYAAYISLAFLAMQLVNVLLNFIFSQKIKKQTASNDELISVLIPARNEEANIGALLQSLCEMKNARLEILVCDDESTDRTSAIVSEFSKKNPAIKLLKSAGLPAGWLGKNHACYQLAQHAAGAYYLFIDADVKLQGTVITDTVSYLKKYRLGLLSIFPTQIMKTFGEKITVPVMNYILLTLLPLIFVRISPFSSHSAANGQFMLFDAGVYKKFEPHQHFKSSSVEDISISRFFKKNKTKIACITGEKRVECRMYTSYEAAINGFSKNIFMFFGNNPVLAFVFWTLSTLGFVPVIIWKWQFFPVYILAVLLIQLIYSAAGRQNPLTNIAFFPLQLGFLLQVMVKSLSLKKQKQSTWKGRNISTY